MNIPDCYDPAVQEAARSLAFAAQVLRRPRCACCGNPLTGDEYLDLEPFGLRGCACERCVHKHRHEVSNLDEGVD